MKNSNNDFGENGINDIFEEFRKKRDEEDDDDKFTNNNIFRQENTVNISFSSNSKKLKNINENKIYELEREVKSLKEEIKKYRNEIKKLKKENEKLKEKKKHSETMNNSIFNNNKIINNEQIINNYSFINMQNDYSFKLNSYVENLTMRIFKGDNEVNFELFLTNNGYETWPENRTKLVFIESSFNKENYNDVILKPQSPKDTWKYDVRFIKLKEYKSDIYISILRFNANGINIGDEIILTVIIEEEYDIPKLRKEEEEDDLSPKSRGFILNSDMNRGSIK